MTRIIYLSLLPLLTILLFSCNEKKRKDVPPPIDTVAEEITVPEKKEKKKEEKVAVEENDEEEEKEEKPSFYYQFINKNEWQSKKDSFEGASHLNILNALNRVDTTHLHWLDSIIVPNDYSRPLKDYLPFPDEVPLLKEVSKIILFSYPTQAFAAYENGELVLTGPTNMGRKKKPTPKGLFFTNWKAKKTISTVDDEWILKWNFNIQNKWGVGFHEYAMPGYPASHSCMRLLGADAQFLYRWANQWMLEDDRTIEAYGTPVIVFGEYPFGKTRPWFKVVKDPNALMISVDSLNHYIQPHLSTIMEKQLQRQEAEARALEFQYQTQE